MDSVTLDAGQCFPGDRKFGFARPNSGFDPADPKPLPKTKFYMLARDATLALLGTEYDDDTGILSLSAPDGRGRFDINTTDGKQDSSQFLKCISHCLMMKPRNFMKPRLSASRSRKSRLWTHPYPACGVGSLVVDYIGAADRELSDISKTLLSCVAQSRQS